MISGSESYRLYLNRPLPSHPLTKCPIVWGALVCMTTACAPEERRSTDWRVHGDVRDASQSDVVDSDEGGATKIQDTESHPKDVHAVDIDVVHPDSSRVSDVLDHRDPRKNAVSRKDTSTSDASEARARKLSPEPARSLGAAIGYSCVVRRDGRLSCWGGWSERILPAPAGPFKTISLSPEHACALRPDDTIMCWGDNSHGESTPPSGAFQHVGVGNWNFSCGLRTDGTITCWGLGSDPNRNEGEADYDQASPPSGTFTDLDVGDRNGCSVRTSGEITCWGPNREDQLDTPPGPFEEVSVGTVHVCGRRPDGTVTCWGASSRADGVPLPGGHAPSGRFLSISSGGRHACGRRPDETVECWGDPMYGMTSPPDGPFRAIEEGGYHSCGVRPNGEVECWGSNRFLQSSPPNDR